MVVVNTFASLADGSANNKPRDKWSSKAEFFLSCLGYAIGYGNLWRFPYLVYDCGGGAFLVAFLIMLITISMPMFFIELALAQYASCGPAKLYRKLCPLLGGVGIAMVFNSVLIFLYYNMIIGWAIYFLYTVLSDAMSASIKNYRGESITRITWTKCDNDYNSPNCYEPRTTALLSACSEKFSFFNSSAERSDDLSYSNVTELPMLASSSDSCEQFTQFNNQTGLLELRPPPAAAVSPAEEFFYNKVLGIADSIEDWGMPLPHLVAVLSLSWLLCFLCLCKGIKSSGKVVWVTATVPYLLLVILFIKGLSIPGHGDGIQYYIQPNLQRLTQTEVWIKAAGQVLYSTAVGGGGLGTYASYNSFNNNVFGDALIVPIVDFCTSVFGGFVVFAFIGFLAKTLGRPVQDAVREGTALVFIAYPEAVGQMQYAVAWGVAFNLLMLTVGIDSQFAMIEIATTAILDEWPHLRRHKSKLFGCVCAAGCALGIALFTTRTGYFWLSLIDYFIAGWPLLFFGLCENIIILVYGVERFSDDVEAMTGRKCSKFMKFCWRYVCPTALGVLLVLSCVRTVPIRYKGIPYTWWAQVIGWSFTLLNIAMVPIYAFYLLFLKSDSSAKSTLPLLQRAKMLLKSTPEWDALAERAEAMHSRPTSSASTTSNGSMLTSNEMDLKQEQCATLNGSSEKEYRNGFVGKHDDLPCENTMNGNPPVILINGVEP